MGNLRVHFVRLSNTTIVSKRLENLIQCLDYFFVVHVFSALLKELEEDANIATRMKPPRLANPNSPPPQTNTHTHTYLHTNHSTTPDCPQSYEYTEPSLTFIICIHNQTNSLGNPQTPRRTSKNLQYPQRHPSQPTYPDTIQYHILPHMEFAARVDPPPLKATIMVPLPNEYHHTHPLKINP